MNKMTNVQTWAKRRDIPLTIIAWIAVFLIAGWIMSHITRTIIICLIAAFLAFALVPAVTFLQRYMAKRIAVVVVYIIVLVSFSLLIYFVINTAVSQFSFVANNLSQFLNLESKSQTPFLTTLQNFGISKDQIIVLESQLTGQAEHLTTSILPVLSSVFTFFLDMLIVAIISIYLLIDGAKLRVQIEKNTPKSQRKRLDFLLSTSQEIIGNYIRGQILLSVIIGLMVGVGMTIFHVPYALLLGVIASLLSFIPILGVLISGVICFSFALTQGWVIAILVIVYFIIAHVVEGDILGPRIVGKAIGLHPLVSIIALIAGSELYGIIGALFAAPAAGLLQAIIVAIWSEWRSSHPKEFTRQEKRIVKNFLS